MREPEPNLDPCIPVSQDQAEGPWPPCCCVAAFVAKALECLGDSKIDRSLIARQLGLKVGPTDENPWGLEVIHDPDFRGLTVTEAEQSIGAVLAAHSHGLAFRHIPFNTVTFELYQNVLEEATAKGCIVGVGFDYGRLTGKPGLRRHIARIIAGPDERSVVLLDDSAGSSPERYAVDWQALERAVYDIYDGFWIVGPGTGLSFDLTLPYGDT